MVLSADRLTTLEIRVAEQEKIIEELSEQIAEQWKVIERLRNALEQFGDRFADLEERAGPRHEAGKPPHW
jgi:SlyX protein